MQKLQKGFDEVFFQKLFIFISVTLFASIAIWWLQISPFDQNVLVDAKHLWSSSYLLISILGGCFGLIISTYWGGYRSVLGRAILAFSIGLFLQSFGQIVYNYYTLVSKIEAPYPSLGDVGYFGSIFAYIYGVLLLGHLSGSNISIRSIHNQIFAIVLPLLMLISSYLFFLKDYVFDWSKPLTIFLDFGYPLGQAIYVSFALLVLIVCRKFLGGIMKKPILLLVFALIVQYTCDFNFLYQANHGYWYAGSWGDFLYAISYLIMTLSLIYMGIAFNKIKNHN